MPGKKPPGLGLAPIAKPEEPKKEAHWSEQAVTGSGAFLLKTDIPNGPGPVVMDLREGGCHVNNKTDAKPDESQKHKRYHRNKQITWKELQMLGKLGRGAQGSVKLVFDPNHNILFAMKSIAVDNKDITKKTVVQETAQLLCSVHRNVLTTVDTSYTGGHIFILMEMMDFTLKEVIQHAGPVPDKVLRAVARQILEGLQHLHETVNLIHRDLKPANILLSRMGDVKIADFGVSTFLRNTTAWADTQTGAQSYMSPERMHGQSHNQTSDVWSVGLVVAYCALGCFPIVGKDDVPPNPWEIPISIFELSARVSNPSSSGVVEWDHLVPVLGRLAPKQNPVKKVPSLEDISPMLRDFVKHCLTTDARSRPTTTDMLTHPFVADLTDPAEVQNTVRDWLKENTIPSVAENLIVEFAKTQPKHNDAIKAKLMKTLENQREQSVANMKQLTMDVGHSPTAMAPPDAK
eukprot:TRINITY_DN48527_c0_g1_i1.p2 TRINITY_DN48527_c0_g1~~TRINITY_DN48527_c0_g1_i1.p2  ORF type:complete len:461 (-),score=6.46 TRINITY_DN48527_c0_g1_i1:1506-2888(-)